MEGIWQQLRKQNASAIAELIKQGVDANAEGYGDQRPIHMASELDDTASIQVLIDGGADFRAEDGQLRTPLLVACEFGSLKAAQCLIDLGASLTATDKTELTPLHWLAYHGALELVELALSKGAPIDAQNDSNETPLMHALMQGRLGCAMLLLDKGADPKAIDTVRCTPLHHAMQGGTPANGAEVAALLERLIGAKVNVDAADKEKRTALHWASGKNLLACVELLLGAGASVNAADWAEQTPLHWACTLNAAESARVLIKSGADPEKADRDSRTPLLCAADRASEGCLRLLLGQPNAKVDTIDWGGFSALHYAARRGAIGCVRILLEKGADRQLAAASGQLPAEVAVGSEVQELLQAELANGGMKRRRLSSSNSLALQGVLPELASAFYAALATGDLAQVQRLCAPALVSSTDSKLGALTALGAQLSLKQMHACTKTCTVAAELGSPAGPLVHMLTFSEDCLLTAVGTYKEWEH